MAKYLMSQNERKTNKMHFDIEKFGTVFLKSLFDNIMCLRRDNKMQSLIKCPNPTIGNTKHKYLARVVNQRHSCIRLGENSKRGLLSS